MNGTKIANARPTASTVVRGDSPGGIQRTRAVTRAFTRGLNPPPHPDVADAILLVVSELATNALRHGGGRYTLELSAGPDTVTVAVSDPNPAVPRARPPDLSTGTGGFGWHMVRRLSREVTITRGRGKTIYASLLR
ncbi:ATP-binding protein [Streptomyces sp. NPDC021212]|uniref:ATP-binding protein n=1 Tax=Streptomyces sp. NPDC021212 TaxID=3365118 RepID=UPI0037992DBD